ncbi:MAG TPA: 3-isopropylmalate dehydratase [Candidatus Cloacimonetes bacterium]|nr:3-isopropylmalate dehydratase [Candidatus Cloacimonadota bacterium]HEX37553.1 3-isopropylmalate dehydratase [Candidatus Cloacimonadota bacterium]
MQKDNTLTGKIWLIIDKNGHLINDIDTDMIFHNQYLAITDINIMGQYAFDNLEGWEDFSKKADKGDIIITGKNFGAGSSRQQAVDCFISLGIQAILAESYGAIYKRNAINSGLPILTMKNIDVEKLNQREEITIDLKNGTISNPSIEIEPFSQVQYDIYKAGNLFTYGKKIIEK